MGHAQQGQTRKRSYKGARLAKLTEAIASINDRLYTVRGGGQLCLVAPAGARVRKLPQVRTTSSTSEPIFPSRHRTNVEPSVRNGTHD